MRFIPPRIHGALDYGVAAALIAAPFVTGFAATDTTAAIVSTIAGLGLVAYSLVTDYSAGVRAVVSMKAHLVLDAVAAFALLVAPFALGFGGVARGFFVAIAVAVLAVVAVSQTDSDLVAADA